MSNLPQIPGARKKGVVLFSAADDLKKLEEYLINDTVCIDGPAEFAIPLARALNYKYKVPVKVVLRLASLAQDDPEQGATAKGRDPRRRAVNANKFAEELPADIELVDSAIEEIVGEGKAEAVKFKNGKAIGVSLILFISEATT
ncbi:MAG: hypothetical protein QME65_00250 [Candidatus Omnitrophota bacterium]|nr:hypothetical protein [Candidatus Omnitrophota bacterium]